VSEGARVHLVGIDEAKLEAATRELGKTTRCRRSPT
jgi:hypothetical protein